MSQQPTKKSNLLQTLLIFTTLFLAYQLFTGGFSKNKDTRTAADVLKQMEKASSNLQADQVAKELPIYEKKIKDEEGKLAGIERKILYAEVLTARTQYLAGIQQKNDDLINKAYTTLSGPCRKHNDEPVWSEAFNFPPNKESKNTTDSAAHIYAEVSNALERVNKNGLVFGFFPGYQFINFLVDLTGAHPEYSYALAALLLAIIVRAIVWPLAQKTTMHSRQLTQLAPLINELKEKYQGVELSQKTMELYKAYGTNPVSGCLPAFAQIPLFILIYQSMVLYKFEFKKGIFLWINPTMSDMTNGFVAPNLGETDYVLVIIYGLSMVVNSLLTPVTDITNIKQQRMTSIMVSVVISVFMFFWSIPSAFVLYWIFTNVFTTLQTFRAYRLPLPPLMKKEGVAGTLVPVGDMSSGLQFKSTGVPKINKPKSKKRK